MFCMLLLLALTGGTIDVQWSPDAPPVITRGPLGDRVTLAGSAPSGKPGTPLLPAVPVMVLLPQGAVADGVEVIYTDEELFSTGFTPMAAQAGAPISMPESFRITPADADAFSNPIESGARLQGQGTLMGYTVADIVIRPFQWNPDNRRLLFTQSLTLRVSYHFDQGQNSIPERGIAGSPAVEAIVRSAVLNPGDFPVTPPRTADLPWGEYLIIADDDLADAFEPLAEFKTWKGIQAKIVSMSYITDSYSGVDDAQRLRFFLHDIYQESPPTYILLAGTPPAFPTGTAMPPPRDTPTTPPRTSTTRT